MIVGGNPNTGPQEYQDLLAMAGEGFAVIPAGTTVELKDTDGNWTNHGVFKNHGTADATIVSGKQLVIRQGKRPMPNITNHIVPGREVEIAKLTEVTITAPADGDVWAYYA